MQNIVEGFPFEDINTNRMLPGVSNLAHNPILKNGLTKMKSFRTIQYGSLDNIKKKGRKKQTQTDTSTRSVAAQPRRRRVDSDLEEDEILQVDDSSVESNVSMESLEKIPLSKRQKLINEERQNAEKLIIEAQKQQLASSNKKDGKKLDALTPVASPKKMELASPIASKEKKQVAANIDQHEDRFKKIEENMEKWFPIMEKMTQMFEKQQKPTEPNTPQVKIPKVTEPITSQSKKQKPDGDQKRVDNELKKEDNEDDENKDKTEDN